MATTQPTNDATTADNTQPTTAATNTNTANDPTTTADGESVAITDLPDLSTAPTVGQTSVSKSDAPSLTATGSIFHLSGVPTIAGYGVPQQTVPWTAGAPFMQTSKLPEGTVFIIVGAVLGFLGMAVLAWRGMVAWSLHRSVKRAALGSHYNDSMLKMKLQPPSTSAGAMGSTLSLDRLSAPAGKLSRPSGRGHSRGGSGGQGVSNTNAARNTSLFFSPTAGAGAHHTSHSVSSNNRSSAYLPAGYYASPSANTPASGNKHASIGGNSLAPAGNATSRLSALNPNHPSNRGYTQTQSNHSDYNISPPDSPGSMVHTNRPSTGGTLPSSRRGYERVAGTGHASHDSWGGLNVPGGAPPGQRAPSANLEDLFEHHGGGMAK
jgi:hypothetical protein